jgi:hypothetical protein
LGHLFLLVGEENALYVLDYPALSPSTDREAVALRHRHHSEIAIGMAGISDRHGPESLIGMARNH